MTFYDFYDFYCCGEDQPTFFIIKKKRSLSKINFVVVLRPNIHDRFISAVLNKNNLFM